MMTAGKQRHKTGVVKVGKVLVGGDNPVSIQSMTNTDTRDVEATAGQIIRLWDAGCEIARFAVPDMEAAEAVKGIRQKLAEKECDIPLVADIHFDYKLALKCIENGINKVRMNPGNIGGKDRVHEVVAAAEAAGVPIRVGVNAGSLEKDILKEKGLCADALVESAMRHVEYLEACNFKDTVISLKSSNLEIVLEAYRKIAKICDYPLHVGVTEAGSLIRGTVKSAIAMGKLLEEGIGDTIRISLTGDPVEEVKASSALLETLGLRTGGVEFVSCPTCGRTRIDLMSIVNEVERRSGAIVRRLQNENRKIKVAMMGCVVNGPGEASDADVGIAGGVNEGLLFKKGQPVCKVPQEKIVDVLIDEMEKL